MNLQQRINAFVKLGDFLSQFSNEIIEKKEYVEYNELFFDGFKNQLKLAEENNGWFSKENLALAERIEKKQQIKFFEGLSTSFELTESQRQLYTMQQNYLQAMFNVISNKATLENALNTPINNRK